MCDVTLSFVGLGFGKLTTKPKFSFEFLLGSMEKLDLPLHNQVSQEVC